MFPVMFAACGGSQDAADNQREWLQVLGRKKAAVAPSARPSEKQAYADTLAAFVGKHPTHSRAREVYQRIQLDFANELASLGRYQDAALFYRTVLRGDPMNEQAVRGLADVASHLAISRQKLLALEKGMSQSDVAHILGKPMPGWTERRERRDAVLESWYYQKAGGGVAGVYFRDGRLFAAEENSHARLAPMTLQ
jgi:hypothetical protein